MKLSLALVVTAAVAVVSCVATPTDDKPQPQRGWIQATITLADRFTPGAVKTVVGKLTPTIAPYASAAFNAVTGAGGAAFRAVTGTRAFSAVTGAGAIGAWAIKGAAGYLPTSVQSLVRSAIPDFAPADKYVGWEDKQRPAQQPTSSKTLERQKSIKPEVPQISPHLSAIPEHTPSEPSRQQLARQKSQNALTVGNQRDAMAPRTVQEQMNKRLCHLRINGGGRFANVFPYENTCVGYLVRMSNVGEKVVGTFGIMAPASCFYPPAEIMPTDEDGYPKITKINEHVFEHKNGSEWVSFWGHIEMTCGASKLILQSNKENDIVRIPAIFGVEAPAVMYADRILANLAMIQLTNACKATLVQGMIPPEFLNSNIHAKKFQKFSNIHVQKFESIAKELDAIATGLERDKVRCSAAGFDLKGKVVYEEAHLYEFILGDESVIDVVKFENKNEAGHTWGPIFCYTMRNKWVLTHFAPAYVWLDGVSSETEDAQFHATALLKKNVEKLITLKTNGFAPDTKQRCDNKKTRDDVRRFHKLDNSFLL